MGNGRCAGIGRMGLDEAGIGLNHGFARDGEVLFLCLSKVKVPKKKVGAGRLGNGLRCSGAAKGDLRG